jgi:hypothetical protein
MADKKDILEILALISVAFPNFKMVQSGEVSTADAYLAFLGDLPADLLKVAVLRCCSEAGRAFAPSVGEIRGAAGEIHKTAQGIPSTLEAWDEVCKAPKPYPPEYVIYRNGEIVPHPVYTWSHPLVERIAKQFGWPDFPKFDNESTERAHFFKQYEAETSHTMNDAMELPEVTHYIDVHNKQIKQLTEGMEK